MQCYVCSRLFEQKAALREHLQQEHDFGAEAEANNNTTVMVTEEDQNKQTVEGRSMQAE